MNRRKEKTEERYESPEGKNGGREDKWREITENQGLVWRGLARFKAGVEGLFRQKRIV